MMGLGYLGNGGPSSSSSNLSPLAPPFTVDRSNPKSNPNPLTNFTDPPPYSVPFSSSLHNWQYPHSSASRPDFFSSCDSEITGSLPPANEYCYLGSDSINPPSTQWSTSNSNVTSPTNPFSYVGAPKQYFPPYPSQVVDDDTSLMGLSEAKYDLLSASGISPMAGSSQVDYAQCLSGLEFPQPWSGVWNGLSEGKRGKLTQADGNFHMEKSDVSGSLVYKDYMKQGTVAVDGSRKYEENPAGKHRCFVDVLGKENLTRSQNIEHLDDTFLVQNPRFSVESSKSSIFASGAPSAESLLESPSLVPVTFSGNHQKLNGPCEKRFQLFDSCIYDCKPGTKSSPTIKIRPPPFGVNSHSSDTVSSRVSDIGNVASVNRKDSGRHEHSIEKEPLLPQSSEGKEGCMGPDKLSFHIGRTDRISHPSSLTKEERLVGPVPRNALDQAVKEKFGAQVPNISIPNGLSLSVDNTEGFKFTSNSSESLDHHNPAEDSPCWRGAPASNVSPFETLETMPPQNLMKKMEVCDSLNFHGVQMFPPCDDSVVAFSHKVCETSLQKDSFPADDDLSFSLKGNFSVDLNEQKSGDTVRPKSDGVQLNQRDGVKFSENIDNPIKECDQHNVSKSDCDSIHLPKQQSSPKEVRFTSRRKNDSSAVDMGICTSDTSEDGFVPLHAVENVLSSPPSGEDAVKPHGMESDPKKDVHMLVNAVHNLSELLLVHCANDAWALQEHDSKALEHAISNIDVCLLKKIVQSTPSQESKIPREGISFILKEGGCGVKPLAVNEIGPVSHGQLNSYCIHEGKGKCDASGKKFEKILDFGYLRDDADVRRHQNMVQDIRKILEENFQLEEHIPSEILLYKNLWLDAEAELCSLGFRARLDRVKTQMDSCKLDKAKDTSMAVEKVPSSLLSTDLDIAHVSNPEANDGPKQDTAVPTSHVDDVEASVMARFQILKCRGDSSSTSNMDEKQQPEVVNIGFSGKRTIGNQTAKKSFDVAVGSRLQQHPIDQTNGNKAGSYLDNPRHETMEDSNVHGTEDAATIQPYRNDRLQNQHGSGTGWYDSTSSDWEHVLKDDFAWQN